ncbi:MAG: hypothetical protein ACK5PF_01870 [bacterium]|jgi:hypothetical protein
MYQPFDLKTALGAEDGVRLTTTTLLPSGALVDVLVRRDMADHYSLSDDGSAHADLAALGHSVLTPADRRKGTSIADRFGLTFSGDEFLLRDVSPDQMAAAVVYVAEASRLWASEVASAAQKRRERDLGAIVEQRLRQILPAAKISRECEVIGASTKRHRFDMVVELPGDRNAVFELASPHPNSVAATHLKLFDLKEAKPEWLREVVTERLADWSAPDMALLNRVASHVRDQESDWSDLANLAA